MSLDSCLAHSSQLNAVRGRRAGTHETGLANFDLMCAIEGMVLGSDDKLATLHQAESLVSMYSAHRNQIRAI